MEQVHTIEATVPSNVAILEFIRDNVINLGWTVLDDQIVASKYLVIHSTGHSKNNGRASCYLKLFVGVTYFNVELNTYWDASTHTGYNGMNYTSTENRYNCGTYCDASTNNGVSIKGNKDFLLFTIFRSSNSSTLCCAVLRTDNPTWDYVAQTQTTVSGGLNKIVQLGNGQATQFKLNTQYRLISSKGHIDKITFNDINLSNDQATIDELHYTTMSGTVIGSCAYPWFSWNDANNQNHKYGLGWITNYKYSSTITNTVMYAGKGVVGQVYDKDVYNHNESSVLPFVFYEYSYGSFGTSSYFQYCYINGASENDKVGINFLETGAASTATLTQVTDATKSWAIDTFKGMSLVLTSGDQNETTRYITGNSSDTLTVNPAFGTVVSGSDTFSICEAMYSVNLRMVDKIVIKDV